MKTEVEKLRANVFGVYLGVQEDWDRGRAILRTFNDPELRALRDQITVALRERHGSVAKLAEYQNRVNAMEDQVKAAEQARALAYERADRAIESNTKLEAEIQGMRIGYAAMEGYNEELDREILSLQERLNRCKEESRSAPMVLREDGEPGYVQHIKDLRAMLKHLGVGVTLVMALMFCGCGEKREGLGMLAVTCVAEDDTNVVSDLIWTATASTGGYFTETAIDSVTCPAGIYMSLCGEGEVELGNETITIEMDGKAVATITADTVEIFEPHPANLIRRLAESWLSYALDTLPDKERDTR